MKEKLDLKNVQFLFIMIIVKLNHRQILKNTQILVNKFIFM